jgi:hypothetical protein
MQAQAALSQPPLSLNGPLAFLSNGLMDTNLDENPIGFTNLANFCYFWGCVANYSTGGIFPWGAICVPNVSPSIAVVTTCTHTNSYNDTVGMNLILYMSPSMIPSFGALCLTAIGITNCSNAGPVAPIAQAMTLGLQYLAVMPNANQYPCFKNCAPYVTSIGILQLPVPGYPSGPGIYEPGGVCYIP